MTDAAKIIAICEREWSDARDDCNKFVKAVAGALGITLTGNADSIVDHLELPEEAAFKIGRNVPRRNVVNEEGAQPLVSKAHDHAAAPSMCACTTRRYRKQGIGG